MTKVEIGDGYSCLIRDAGAEFIEFKIVDADGNEVTGDDKLTFDNTRAVVEAIMGYLGGEQ